MKAAVITFPGSNCDDDAFDTLRRFGGFEVQRIWHKDRPSLEGVNLVVLPGGFSYGDYLRCGAMAALSPVMEEVKRFAEKGGLVLGICNGFQILCESRLLPGTLTMNESQKFICKDVSMRVEKSGGAWATGLQVGEVVSYPVAHGDGRYWIDEAGLGQLEHNGQVLLRYSDASGKVAADFNPNGSTANIAGICNERGNVFGLMPHPERATEHRSQHGLKLWKSIQTVLTGGAA
ncbi:phosphoribosylformylglycinamidine synthase I [bacterium]|nr:phosphoribosylformylglycinamidine synthase I [bacterium]